MAEDAEGVDPEVLRQRLPNRWEVTARGKSVYGRTETPNPEGAAAGVSPTTEFAVRPVDGSLWRAIWRPPVGSGHGAVLVTDQVTGTEERCVEWVVEKATGNVNAKPETNPADNWTKTSVSRAIERESIEMVREWMERESHDELSDFLARVGRDQFFDEDGEPREVFLAESGDWEASEVFTALWEGRSIADAGNVDAFKTALRLAETWFGETVLERLERD